MSSISILKMFQSKKITAIYVDNNEVYIGVNNEFYTLSSSSGIIQYFDKSIRVINGDDNKIVVGSYDGTAIIYKKDSNSGNLEYIDRIVGPETEIKGASIDEDHIALCTRGKTVWILENLNILHVLDDHTQDVKGCRYIQEEESQLLTWSYDKKILIYAVDRNGNEYVMINLIETDSIVWNVEKIDEGKLAVFLHNGKVEIYNFSKIEKKWLLEISENFSLYPLYNSCKIRNNLFATVCNKRVLVIANSALQILHEEYLIEYLNDEVTTIYYHNNILYFGTNKGRIGKVQLNI